MPTVLLFTVINRNAYRLEFPNSTEVHDVFHISLPDRYVNSVPINISNAVPVNNRATYIERRQRIIAETHENTVELVDEYHRENPSEPKA
jgi:hypothetical protein